MKKIIILFLCCVLLTGCSMSTPTTEITTPTTSETIVTEESTEIATVPTLSKQAEKKNYPKKAYRLNR